MVFGNAVAMDGGEITLEVLIDGGEINLVSEAGGEISEFMPILPESYTGTTDVTPTEEVQTLPTNGLIVNDDITIEAIPSDYVGSAIPNRTELDVEGYTVTALAGYYADEVSADMTPDLEDISRSYTPTESAQSETITASQGYDGIGEASISVGAIPSDYVGSGITRRGSADLTSSGATVTVPNGFYEENASKSIPTGTVVPANVITAVGATLTASDNKLSLYRESLNAPYVSTPGYIESGTQGKTKITLTADVNTRSTSDLTVSGDTVTAPSGYYGASASASVQAGSATTPTGGITANPSITVSSGGLITASVNKAESITPIVSEGYVSSGTAGTITFSGSNTSQLDTQAATSITPTETAQTAVPQGKWTTGAVTVDAIPSNYVGSGVTRRTSSDMTASGATVTAPAGYYESASSKSISNGSAKTPATTITANPTITVSTGGLITATASSSKSVTPTVTAGYVSSGTAGTVTVTGTKTEQLSTQAAATITPTTTAQTAVAAYKYTTGAVTVDPIPPEYIVPSGTLNISNNGTADVTQYATVNVSVSGGSPNLQNKSVSYTPSETAQTDTITADAGYDGLNEVGVSVGAISSTYVGTGVTRNSSADLTASGATVTAPAGYYENNATKTIASGSATPPSTITATSATLSTSSNTLTLTKSVSTTPVVTAGYVASGTAGTVSVSLSAPVTMQAAQTIYPSTSDQTIASGRYLTGIQTIKAVSQTNLAAENIKDGTTISISNGNGNIWSVTGTYTGGGGGTTKNVQVIQATTRTSSSTLTAIGGEITCSKTGTYDVYWTGTRSTTSTSYTYGTQLYIGGTAYGTQNTAWNNHVQINHLTSVSLTANQKVRVYGRNSRGSSYYIYAPMLAIVEN